MEFVKEICDISDSKFSIIMHSRNVLLFSNGRPCVKKGSDEDFDVPMECYDGTEICKLIGTYLLYQINNIIWKENIGLHRDNGLGIFKNITCPEIERGTKKDLIRIFESNGLSIKFNTSPKVAILVDVDLNLIRDIYQPYKKPKNNPLYINKKSNHPLTVLKQIAKAIWKRIFDISSSKDIYDQNISYYNIFLSYSSIQE